MTEAFAALAFFLGIVGAPLNIAAALLVKDGRWPLRVFAAVVCVAVTLAYFVVIVWLAPSTLPPWIGRSLFASLLAIVCGYPFIDLWVRYKNK